MINGPFYTYRRIYLASENLYTQNALNWRLKLLKLLKRTGHRDCPADSSRESSDTTGSDKQRRRQLGRCGCSRRDICILHGVLERLRQII